jgi:hypothetical protein
MVLLHVTGVNSAGWCVEWLLVGACHVVDTILMKHFNVILMNFNH